MGVAISTTGDKHRMPFLETCVRHWDAALPVGAALFVTVDGSEEDTARVAAEVADWTMWVFRVGQHTNYPTDCTDRHRLGVAVNKNTGIELLMDDDVDHLFLSDDDTWPLHPRALAKHTDLAASGVPHSMVCWGGSRLLGAMRDAAFWTWPRGAMLYQTRDVVERVGGMDERFGVGGHEHVEYSNRIFNSGLTPSPYTSPLSYAKAGMAGAAMRAGELWHAEDMRRPGEPMGNHRLRRRVLTSIQRTPTDWSHIDKIMTANEGSTDYMSFRARENGRASATLCPNLTCAVEPAEPRSKK